MGNGEFGQMWFATGVIVFSCAISFVVTGSLRNRMSVDSWRISPSVKEGVALTLDFLAGVMGGGATSLVAELLLVLYLERALWRAPLLVVSLLLAAFVGWRFAVIPGRATRRIEAATGVTARDLCRRSAGRYGFTVFGGAVVFQALVYWLQMGGDAFGRGRFLVGWFGGADLAVLAAAVALSLTVSRKV